ncbi:MAG: hypothetical protein ACK55I_39645, partial [bacterium]
MYRSHFVEAIHRGCRARIGGLGKENRALLPRRPRMQRFEERAGVGGRTGAGRWRTHDVPCRDATVGYSAGRPNPCS